MPGRGPQTFKKRQKEQQRKDKQQEKLAKRLQRKDQSSVRPEDDDSDLMAGPGDLTLPGEFPELADPSKP